MLIEGQLTEHDYIAAQYLHMRQKPLTLAVIVMLPILAAVLCVLDGASELIWILVVAIVLAGLTIAFVLRQSRKTFRQFKALAEPVRFEVRDNGLYARRTNGEGLIPWSEVHKWKQNAALILLYPAKNIFYVVPKRFFQNQTDFGDFAALLRAKLGDAKT